MHTSTSPAHTPEAGPVVPQRAGAVHPLVHLTAVRSDFTMRSLNEWLERDIARREAGTLDTMDYLVAAFNFLVDVTASHRAFAKVCRDEKGKKEALRTGIESTLATLREFRIAGVNDMEAHCRLLTIHGAQLEACITNFDGIETQIAELFDKLEARVNALTTPFGQVTAARRPN
jgi:hypothetical protein